MSDDSFFDTSFEDQDIEIEANLVAVGDDINLIEKNPALKRVLVGLGWDLNAFDADAVDLDVSCLLLDKDGQTLEDQDFVFYNNMKARDGAVVHNGDNRTGAGDGDDETMLVELEKLPFDIMRALFVISIYQGFEKEQNLGMLKNAYIRLVDADTKEEMFRFVLEEELKDRTETAMLVAAIDREGPKWHLKPLGEFEERGLEGVATDRGMIISDAV